MLAPAVMGGEVVVGAGGVKVGTPVPGGKYEVMAAVVPLEKGTVGTGAGGAGNGVGTVSQQVVLVVVVTGLVTVHGQSVMVRVVAWDGVLAECFGVIFEGQAIGG